MSEHERTIKTGNKFTWKCLQRREMGPDRVDVPRHRTLDLPQSQEQLRLTGATITIITVTIITVITVIKRFLVSFFYGFLFSSFRLVYVVFLASSHVFICVAF